MSCGGAWGRPIGPTVRADGVLGNDRHPFEPTRPGPLDKLGATAYTFTYDRVSDGLEDGQRVSRHAGAAGVASARQVLRRRVAPIRAPAVTASSSLRRGDVRRRGCVDQRARARDGDRPDDADAQHPAAREGRAPAGRAFSGGQASSGGLPHALGRADDPGHIPCVAAGARAGPRRVRGQADRRAARWARNDRRDSRWLRREGRGCSTELRRRCVRAGGTRVGHGRSPARRRRTAVEPRRVSTGCTERSRARACSASSCPRPATGRPAPGGRWSSARRSRWRWRRPGR